jgi:L-iditol 2-dehydrogenase
VKALLLSDYNRLEISDVPMPRPHSDEVLIRVEACGICGSDVHGFDGSTGRRIPPLIMGHEASGVVSAIGTDVSRFHPGDRVTFDSTIYCGQCPYCLRGEVNLCDRRQVLGVSTPEFKREGAFAEYVVVPERLTYALPANIPFEHAAMIEPLAVAVHAVSLAPIEPETVAVVFGAGMIGTLILQVLRAKGCASIAVVDVDDTRLATARELGASHTVNAKTTDPVADLQRWAGRPVDVALEAVGSTPTVKASIECVRKGGTVVLVGNVSPSVDLPLQAVVSKQLKLFGSAASSGEYPECIELLQKGAVRVDGLITAIAPLEQGPDWFARLHAREPNLMKVILSPR